FGAACPAAWPGLVDVERAAYDAAKAAKADVIAFPSIQIDLLYGYSACPPPMQRDDCYDANFAMLENVKRDRFAFSTYPCLIAPIQPAGGLPASFSAGAGDRGGERTVVRQTGFLSTNVVAPLPRQCFTANHSDETLATKYFDAVIAAARGADMDL